MRETNDATLDFPDFVLQNAQLGDTRSYSDLSREFLLARRPTYREYDHVLVELSGGVPSLCPSK